MAKARASPAARAKAASKHTDPADGADFPVHSLRNLLADLATLTRNVVQIGQGRVSLLLASTTPLQRRALDLLGANLAA